MARTQVAVTRLVRTTPTIVAVSSAASLDNVNGSWLANDGSTVLLMLNSSGGNATIQVLVPESVDQDLAVSPRTYTLANATTYLTGYFPIDTYGSQLLVNSSVANVHVLAYTVR